MAAMTSPEQDANPNKDRERLADEAMGRDPDDTLVEEGEPWAKTSSGDADSVTEDE
jgi:hypothetical protein